MTDQSSGPANLLRAKSAGGRPKKNKRRRSPVSMRTVTIFLLAVSLIGVGIYGTIAAVQSGGIAKGVKVSALDLGGMTADQAEEALRRRIASFKLTFVLAGNPTQVAPHEGSKGGTVASYDVGRAIKGALDVGRDVSAIRALAETLNASVFGARVDLPYKFDRVALRSTLEERFKSAVTPARDARFVVTIDANGKPTVTVAASQEGVEVDYDAVMRAADERLREFSENAVVVPIRKGQPQLEQEDLAPLIPAVIAAMARTPLTLNAKEETWTVSTRTLADWIAAVPPAQKGGKATLGLDKDKVGTFFAARSSSVAVIPKNAVFEEKDGRVTKFEPSVDGETLDVNGSIAAIEKALFAPQDDPGASPAPVRLPIAPVPPDIDTASSNSYGIKEVIGIGESNFRGSPRNRRHNIAVGAKSVHGTLVPPGQEFSMLKTLGTIDGTTGYLQELVIKGNETKPEYGGGLCQIGSTAFRGVLASGLPVTARQNHSYRVPYYERDGDGAYIGPGKDATIYDPAPDFKFKNDTGHHILITTAIDGNKLSFIFWGTKDGRTAEQTAARVFNIVPPPEKKIIETDTLKPGEEKCTEKPHVGSDAVFSYTVTYPDGTVKKEDFRSHYRPWQEVCLVGKDPNAPAAPGTGTSDGGVPSQDASGATGN